MIRPSLESVESLRNHVLYSPLCYRIDKSSSDLIKMIIIDTQRGVGGGGFSFKKISYESTLTKFLQKYLLVPTDEVSERFEGILLLYLDSTLNRY